MISTTHGLQRRTQCAVSNSTYGRRIQDVIPTVTPGLVVVYYPVMNDSAVTHQRSGMGLGGYVTSAQEAQDIADAIGELTDWTRPADELSASSELRRKLVDMGVTGR